tara:strand:- start:773 stop:1390 length:618 start_codon:yes stop_codon:yes gene_type:complete
LKHKYLKDVKADHHFILKTGDAIKNLEDLLKQLRGMDDDTFLHHVNDHKNDFSKWINDIIKDKDLADSLGSIIKKAEMLHTVKGRIKQLKKRQKVRKTTIKVKTKAAKIKKTRKKSKKSEKDISKEVEKAFEKHKVKILEPVTEKEWVGDKMEKVVMGIAEKVGGIEKDRKEFERKNEMIKGINDFFLGLIIGVVVGLVLARFLF